MKKQLLFILFLVLSYQSSFSQSNLFIDTTFTIEEMVMDFFDDPNISVSNITSVSSSVNAAFFDAGGTDLGVNAGIVLSTGSVLGLPEAASNLASSNLSLTGDDDINSIGNSLSNDAVVLEFDFTVSMTDTLHFNYVFGSEEYPEWVGSTFNDAFAFLISGPGITGPFSNNAKNISMVPNSADPVSINTVNNMQNASFYIDNEFGTHIAFDGLTVPLPSSFFAVGGETYHIKLVIADRGDAVLDSGVFLGFNSLNQDSLLSPPSNFQFSINAQNGEVEFVNESKYARTWHWDFGNNETSTERHPGPVNYSTPGDYVVTLTTQNFCCSEVHTATVSVLPAPLSANVTTTDPTCFGLADGEISLEIFGGTAPYSITWSNGETTPTISNLVAGSYSYTIIDADGVAISDMLNLLEPTPIVIENVNITLPSGGNNGSIDVTVSGGTPPYIYTWPIGGPGIPSGGTYDLIITDANGCTIETSFDVAAILQVAFTVTDVSCFGGSDGSIDIIATGGTPPYSFSSSPAISDFENLPAGNYSITIIDAMGQTSGLVVIITEPTLIEITTTSNPATGANADGSAIAEVTGGDAPYTYLWSNGETGSEANNLEAGEYTVYITDANDCAETATVIVESTTSTFDNNEITVNLFPNPVTDKLQVEWSETNAIQNILMVNVLGQSLPIHYDLNGNVVNISFDKNMIKGTYFLQLYFDDGKKATARFVFKGK